jgi:dGTPase
MEDVLQASSKRLVRLNGKSPHNVRAADDYIIQHSEEMLGDMGEIWRNLQGGRLHRDRRVVAANLHAARLVAELTIVLSIMPELIEQRFRLEHERLRNSRYLDHYRKLVGAKVTFASKLLTFVPIHVMIGTSYPLGSNVIVSVEDLIMAKDYVAALSDSRARLIHRQVLGGQAHSP